MNYASNDPALGKGKEKAIDNSDEDAQTIQPHVIVVDDESIFLDVHEAMFKEQACTVSIACDASQALAYLGLAKDTQGFGIKPVAKVSLVCSDYYMTPGMTGYELLKKIKESPTTKNVPVVIVSSDIVPDQIIECMEAGAVMFVAKPLKSADVEHLAQLMKNPAC